MTALNEYQRLESTGIWRASPDEQRRDVMVSVGDASLVIYDSAGRPLGHWSLPAVIRLNVGTRPALFAPGPDAPEELEINEDEMIDAIEKVRKTIEKRRPRQGRLRFFCWAEGWRQCWRLAFSGCQSVWFGMPPQLFHPPSAQSWANGFLAWFSASRDNLAILRMQWCFARTLPPSRARSSRQPCGAGRWNAANCAPAWWADSVKPCFG